MLKQFFRFHKPAVPQRPVKAAALKAFCLVRRTQRQVTQLPHHARSVMRDVSEAWRESARIVPNE